MRVGFPSFRFRWCLSSLLLALGPAAWAQPGYRYTVPTSRADGWPTTTLTEARMDSIPLQTFFRALPPDAQHGLHGLVVVRQGRLVLERYWAGHTVDQPHDIRSVTKSVTALLTGLAADQGRLRPQDSIWRYLPAYAPLARTDPRKPGLTLHHLLTMSTGLACSDWDRKSPGQEERMYRQPDWVRHTLALPQRYRPGDSARYCTGGVVVLGQVLAQATAQPADTFAARHLFGPLGIRHAQWAYFDKGRQVDTGGHLRLTPRDLAKLGQLVLDSGRWQGRPLISPAWIATMTRPHVRLAGNGYGYGWWQFVLDVPGRGPVVVAGATGTGGQYIFVVPSYQLVVVFTGGNYHSQRDKAPFFFLRNVLLVAAQP